jgi:hypothetical protein
MIPAVSTQADVSTFAKSATGANPRRDEIRAIIGAERIALRLPILMNTINLRLRENSRKENRKGSKDRFSGGRDRILPPD